MAQAALQELLARWQNNEASDEDIRQLLAAVESRDAAQAFGEPLLHLWQTLPADSNISEAEVSLLAEAIIKKITPGKTVAIQHRVHFFKTAWFRWAAAIIILFGIGTYIFSHTSQARQGGGS